MSLMKETQCGSQLTRTPSSTKKDGFWALNGGNRREWGRDSSLNLVRSVVCLI